MHLFPKGGIFSHARAQSIARVVVRYLHKKDVPVVLNLRNFMLSNIEAELDDIPSVERRFSERGLEPPIELYDLKSLYALLQRQSSYQLTLHETLSQFDLFEKKLPDYQMNETKPKGYYVLRQINDFEKCFLRLRNQILYHCFSLPNELHARTPTGKVDLVLRSSVSDGTAGQDHIEVGHRLGVLKYSNPASYYLLNEAANLEIALQNYLSDTLTRELNFKPFRNPDTCHEFLLKGIYVDNYEHEGLVLENALHRLVGGASFASFCAYKAGSTAHNKFMPERFFACGRRYVLPSNNAGKGLFSVVQRSNIQAFIATSTEEEIDREYENMLEWLISLYERLGVDFRVCNKRAETLHLSESLRTVIQLYSSHLEEYVDVAHISFSGDFISQRITALNHDKDRVLYTTWLLDVAVTSIQTLLGIFLEKSADELFVPECLRPYMYKTSRSHRSFTNE